MIFLSSVAATLVFFDHSGDITNINISTSVGIEVSKGAKIRNRYNQVPHLTQNINGQVTNSQ